MARLEAGLPLEDPDVPDLFARFTARTKPAIAAIDGYAIGGGFELALACDIRVATADSWFGLPEPRAGMLGQYGLDHLSRVIPLGEALKLQLTGGRIDARRAHDIGLIQEVSPDRSSMFGMPPGLPRRSHCAHRRPSARSATWCTPAGICLRTRPRRSRSRTGTWCTTRPMRSRVRARSSRNVLPYGRRTDSTVGADATSRGARPASRRTTATRRPRARDRARTASCRRTARPSRGSSR